MAQLMVLAVRDSAVQAYSRPFFVPTVQLGVRSFMDEVRRDAPDNPMHKHASDFELHVLAVFDESTGRFEPHPEFVGGRECVMRGADVPAEV